MLSWMIYCFLWYTINRSKLCNIKNITACLRDFFLFLSFFLSFLRAKFFFVSTELLNYLRRNGERRRLRNLHTATGVTECGHQAAVILVKLMFCRGGAQYFLLRRTLYPVFFHCQWSCVSFPLCKAVWAQSCDPVLWIFWDWVKGESEISECQHKKNKKKV